MIDLFLGRVLAACAALSAAILAAVALSISLNVLLRNTLGTPIYGLLDAVEYGLLLATFLGAPWVLSRSAHVAVDLVTAALPTRIARPLARVMAVLGCAVCLVVIWYGTQAALVSAGRGSMIRKAFVIPEWWTLAVVPVAFALMALEFARQALRPQGGERSLSGL